MFRFFGVMYLIYAIPELTVASINFTGFDPLLMALLSLGLGWVMIYCSKELAERICKGLEDDPR